MSDHRSAYDRFVAELARYPDMINRLLGLAPARRRLRGLSATRRTRRDHRVLQHPSSRQAPARSPTPAPAPAETDPSLRRLGRRSTNTSGRSTRPTWAPAGSTRFLLPPRLPDQ